MPITDRINAHYKFPFKWYPFQESIVNETGNNPRAGHYIDVGGGKTGVSTAIALWFKISQGTQTLVIMPPILIKMWGRWLDRISPAPTWVAYAGTPKQRAQVRFDADFILMSMQIFKKDYDYVLGMLKGHNLTVIVDEATSIKNVGSDNHKALSHLRVTFCVLMR